MITLDVEERIDAYEAALKRGESAAALLEEFLPPAEAPEYPSTLVELLRITLEREWGRGQSSGIDRYRTQFPALFADLRWLEPLAFEEYRLRCGAGECVDKQDYQLRYGVNVTSWPDLAPLSGAAAGSIRDEDWLEYSRTEPASALEAIEARSKLPQVGESFGTFELVTLLGEGAFGRVFLARQQTLAGRLVALKITFGQATEAQKLARLQHGSIMPVYSVHRRGKLSGICMPFLGSATLADVIGRLKREVPLPQTAESLVKTLEERRAEFSTLAESQFNELAALAQESESREDIGKAASRPSISAGSLETYVARLMLQVTDGLAQAHDRGILHRDIKPANILIADDGQPLLLDFNLAVEQSGHVARIGGTLPYMSPEQLAQFRGSGQPLDGRSDLYALGVVIYECLTGRQPFEVRRGTLDSVVDQMITDREATPADVRSLNKTVSPGLAAIVARCLQPDRKRRYQRASELRDDLKLHLENHPLKYAPNLSRLELAAKWRRRHPRLTSISSVLAIVGCLAAIAASIWYSREEKLAGQVAADVFRTADDELLAARSLLLIGGKGSAIEAEGIRKAVAGFKHYSVLFDRAWTESSNVRRLPVEQQRQLGRDLTEVLLLLARPSLNDARNDFAELRDSARLEQLAQESRRELIGTAPSDTKAGNDDSDVILALANRSPGESWTETERQLRAITVGRPRDAFAWLALAHFYRLQSKFAEAEAAATAAVALRPELELAWHLRGLVYQAQRRWLEAEEDFTRAIELRANHPSAYFNRGICRQEQQKHRGALADFTNAIEQHFSETRVYFSRGRSFREIGDVASAAADLKHGQSLQPRDALSFVARALSYLPDDATTAEADLKSAQQLEPGSRVVLMNLAHVQAEHLHKAEEAIEVLAQIQELHPSDTDAMGSRAVLFARLQKQAEATAELKKLLKVDVRPPLAIYQSACVYALLSKEQPKLRAQAMQLLATSLAMQPSLIDTARNDADLANLQAEPMFGQLVPPSQPTK